MIDTEKDNLDHCTKLSYLKVIKRCKEIKLTLQLKTMDNVSLELKCMICFEWFGNGYKQPRVLECGHTFCEECLMNLIAMSNKKCGNCRETITLKSAGSYPINYGLKRAAEEIKAEMLKIQAMNICQKH